MSTMMQPVVKTPVLIRERQLDCGDHTAAMKAFQWSGLIGIKSLGQARDRGRSRVFSWGGDDVPYNWLTVYFSDLLSPMTVLALTS